MHLEIKYWTDPKGETPIIDLQYDIPVSGGLVRTDLMLTQIRQVADKVYADLLDKFKLTDPNQDTEHG